MNKLTANLNWKLENGNWKLETGNWKMNLDLAFFLWIDG